MRNLEVGVEPQMKNVIISSRPVHRCVLNSLPTLPLEMDRISARGFPASSPIPCDMSEPGTVIEETVSAGGNSLSYNATADQYSYIWKTDRAWKGTCRMLIVKFNDDSQCLAKFRFK